MVLLLGVIFTASRNSRVTPLVRVPETGPRGRHGTRCSSTSIPESWRPRLTVAGAGDRAPVTSLSGVQGSSSLFLQVVVGGEGEERKARALSSPVSDAMVGHAVWWHSPLLNPEIWGEAKNHLQSLEHPLHQFWDLYAGMGVGGKLQEPCTLVFGGVVADRRWIGGKVLFLTHSCP